MIVLIIYQEFPGVGPKTAQKLLNKYGSVEGIIENKDKIKGSVGNENSREQQNSFNVKRTSYN